MKQVLSAYKSHVLNNGGADAVVAPTALRRKSITFSVRAVTGTYVTLSNSVMAAIDDPAGLLCLAISGVSVYTFTYEIHGECVRQAWHAFTANNMVLSVLEAFDAED